MAIEYMLGPIKMCPLPDDIGEPGTVELTGFERVLLDDVRAALRKKFKEIPDDVEPDQNGPI